MTRPNKLLVLLACVIAAALLAACGSSSSSSSASSVSVAAGGSARRAKLEACLKTHGVSFPRRAGGGRPRGGRGGLFGGGYGPLGGGYGAGRRGSFRPNPKFQAAMKACGANFPNRGRFSATARKQAINDFVTCVRTHGYDLPKPNLSGRAPVFPAAIEHQSKFQKAAKACASTLRPPGVPRGPGAGSAPGGST